MYPEGGAGAAPMDGGKSKFLHLEGLIPLILILIIVAFLGHKFGFWTLPFLGGAAPIQMLIIGQPSYETLTVLDESKDLVSYSVRSASAFSVSASDAIAQYNIVMLDQSTLPQQQRAVSRHLGEALQNYVKTGGKLIVVKNSGIFRQASFNSVATDIVGWKATFGDIVPVACNLNRDNFPTCLRPLSVSGVVFRADYDHPIMEGIEFSPALSTDAPYNLEVYDVLKTGNEIAYVKDMRTEKYYTGIVESTLIFGKTIYFNYDPGMTRSIFQKTLEYLK